MSRTLIHILSVVCLVSAVAEPAAAQRRSRFRRSLRSNDAVKASFKAATTEPSKSTVRVLIDDKPVALGCVVSAEGEVLTKASLVKEGTLTLRLPDGSKVPAERQKTDEPFDLILLKAKSGSFTPIKFSDATPNAGRFVAAPTETGTIMGVGLVTIDAKRAGLRRSRNDTSQQRRSYLGVSLVPSQGGGVLVNQQVQQNAPVYRYGIRRGDKIMSLDGDKVNSVDDVRQVLRRHKPRDRIEVVVIRDGDEKKATIRLGTPPGIDQWGGGPFSERRYNFPTVITHDIRIQPAECGGPLVSSSGEVVGLNIARALRVATYAIPGEAIEGLLTKLRPAAAVSETVPETPGNISSSRLSAPGDSVAPLAMPKPNLPAPEIARTIPVPPTPVPPSPGPPTPVATPPVPPTTPPATAPVKPSAPINGASGSATLFVYQRKVSDAPLSRFMNLAEREKSRVVLIDAGEHEPQPTVKKLRAAWANANGVTFHRISVTTPADANDATRLKVLQNATAVWVTGAVPASTLSGTKLADSLQAVQLKR